MTTINDRNSAFHPTVASTPHSRTGIDFPDMVPSRLPPTKGMVDDAFHALNNRKGCTMQAIIKYIANTYEIVVTKNRYALIRKHVKELQAQQLVVNVTGKGLVGHLRMVQVRRRLKHQPAKHQLNIVDDGSTTPPNQSLAQRVMLFNAPPRDSLGRPNILAQQPPDDTPNTSQRGRPHKRRMLMAPNNPSQSFEEQEPPMAKKNKAENQKKGNN